MEEFALHCLPAQPKFVLFIVFILELYRQVMQNSFASTVFKVLTQIVLLLGKAKPRLSSFRNLKSAKSLRADACQCRRPTLNYLFTSYQTIVSLRYGLDSETGGEQRCGRRDITIQRDR